MQTFTEGKHPGEFLVTEAPGTLSRDTVTVTVPANTTYEPGTVLGQFAATDKYAPVDDTNTDGTETAAGILFGKATNDADAPVDVDAVVINLNAEVRAADLVWVVEGVDEDAAIAGLRQLGIKAR